MLVNAVVKMQRVVPYSLAQPDSRVQWRVDLVYRLSGSGAVGYRNTSNALPVLQKHFKSTSRFVITTIITRPPALLDCSRSHARNRLYWSGLIPCMVLAGNLKRCQLPSANSDFCSMCNHDHYSCCVPPPGLQAIAQSCYPVSIGGPPSLRAWA